MDSKVTELEIDRVIKKYIQKLSKEISVDRAFLYGSCASKQYDKNSDIDLAIFSKSFDSIPRREATRFLLLKALDFIEYDLEPIGYGYNEFIKRENPFFNEIINTGIVIK
ncbi:MAG: nucleotidyltransferase domain-containing protein [Candidatus Atribacteria bacterium]|nr:nucleotidyltransferase domain-containing protein [Candidatus Atribacteria bacterium]